MKTKIVYLVALLCALTFSTSAFADAEAGFYEKDHIRGFISIGGDYRGMLDAFQKYVNSTAFWNDGHELKSSDSSSKAEHYSGTFSYPQFDDWYIGLHVNIGAQYKQFLTWFNINFMPTQISEKSADTYTVTSESGYSAKMPLFDVKWFTYGADWMFGWKLFGENTFINLIPSVGFGFNLINFHMASIFDIKDQSSSNVVKMRDRYYSTMALSLAAELEFRLEFGPFGIGIYGGYRYIDYNELEVEGKRLTNYAYDTDNCGDTWFVGLRLTWTFMSDWERKQADKL